MNTSDTTPQTLNTTDRTHATPEDIINVNSRYGIDSFIQNTIDNVIDNNYYPTKEAKYANMKHRAVGLGLMGFQDAIYQLNLSL